MTYTALYPRRCMARYSRIGHHEQDDHYRDDELRPVGDVKPSVDADAGQQSEHDGGRGVRVALDETEG